MPYSSASVGEPERSRPGTAPSSATTAALRPVSLSRWTRLSSSRVAVASISPRNGVPGEVPDVRAQRLREHVVNTRQWQPGRAGQGLHPQTQEDLGDVLV